MLSILRFTTLSPIAPCDEKVVQWPASNVWTVLQPGKTIGQEQVPLA